MKKTLSVLILMVLICTSSYALTTPNTNAYEIEPRQTEGLTSLSKTLGLNLPEYTDITSQTYPQTKYANAVPQEEIRYQLQSPTNTIDTLCSFVNGQLRMIHILENEGRPHLVKPTENIIEMTKNILDNCAQYTKNPIYTQLRTQLNEAQLNQNTTHTTENIKLEITHTDQSTTFRWTYITNGVEAPDKCVAIQYKDNSLSYFIDNWNIYRIANTNLNLTEAEAIEIALQAANAFSWKIGSGEHAVEVKNFNVTQAMIKDIYLMNMPHAESIRGDLLTLYPLRHIWVSLDKFYPGNVYGIEVFIWADTKEICYVHERISTLDPPEELVASNEAVFGTPPPVQAQTNSTPVTMMLLVGIGVFALGLGSVLFVRKQVVAKRFFKLSGVLLCLILVTTMFVSIATVSAEPRRRAVVWGSESTGDPPSSTPNPWSPSSRKTLNEINEQYFLAYIISYYFQNNGYVSENYQGEGTIKAQVLNNITKSQDYSKSAHIDFNHGVGTGVAPNGFHYMFEDNIGTTGSGTPANNGVFDHEIYTKTTSGNTFFTFINTCKSASIGQIGGNYTLNPTQGIVSGTNLARSMPFAWTHRTVIEKTTSGFNTNSHMSKYGYESGANGADNGAFCYIGFPHGSAALDQTIQTTHTNVKYSQWVRSFFMYALNYDLTVRQALNHASQEHFTIDFGTTQLYTGFDALWPMYYDNDWHYDPMVGCTMAVYGNGEIRLFEHIVRLQFGYSSAGSGFVSNPNGFIGPQPDGSYTRLYAGGTGDQAVVKGAMGHSGADQARGRIWINAYSATSNSRLRVYVSNDNANWYLVNSNVLISSGGSRWVDCGNYASTFRYISFTVYRESSSDYSNDLYIDSVLVIPPTYI